MADTQNTNNTNGILKSAGDAAKAAASKATELGKNVVNTITGGANKAGADTKDATILDANKTGVDTKDATTLDANKTGVDTKDAATSDVSKAGVDTKDAATLDANKAGADTKDAATLDATQSNEGATKEDSSSKNTDEKDTENSEHNVTFKELYSESLAKKYLLGLELEAEGAEIKSEEAEPHLAKAFEAKFSLTALESDSINSVDKNCQQAVQEVLDKANNMVDNCLKHLVTGELKQDPEVHCKVLERIEYKEGNELLIEFLNNASNVLKEANVDDSTRSILLEKVLGVSFEGTACGEGENAEIQNDINTSNQLV